MCGERTSYAWQASHCTTPACLSASEEIFNAPAGHAEFHPDPVLAEGDAVICAGLAEAGHVRRSMVGRPVKTKRAGRVEILHHSGRLQSGRTQLASAHAAGYEASDPGRP